jgi:hypothetical protein
MVPRFAFTVSTGGRDFLREEELFSLVDALGLVGGVSAS